METPDLSRQWHNKAIWRLIWPLAVEQFLAVTIGIADTIMVTGVGEAAVSGVSLVDQINVLLITLFSALATGGAVVISQYIGRRDRANASGAAVQLIYSIVAVSMLIGVVTLVLNRLLLRGIYGNIEAEVMRNAEIYFVLSAISYPFLGLYNAGASIFRSMGNSKVSMAVSALSNVINIGGNALLIYGLKWGVAGAGTATLVSRVVCCIAVMWMLLRHNHGPVTLEGLGKKKPDFGVIKRILTIGVPNGIENSVFQIGKIIMARIVTSFGTAAIAANAVAGTIMGLGTVSGNAVSLGLLTVIGQCAGAGDVAAAKKLLKKFLLLCHGSVLVLCLAMLGLLGPMLGLYNLSPEATKIARDCCTLFMLCAPFFWPASFALPNALRAAGDVRYTMVASLFSMWVFRIGLAFLFAHGLGLGVLGVWAATMVDWVVRGILFMHRWHKGKWEKKRVI